MTRKGGTKGALKPTRLLRDLRYVFANPAPEDPTKESSERRNLRKFMADNMPGFMTLFSKEEHLQRVRSQASVAAANKADEGSELALAAIDELLAEWDGKQVG